MASDALDVPLPDVAQAAAAGDFKHLGPAGDFDSDPAAGVRRQRGAEPPAAVAGFAFP